MQIFIYQLDMALFKKGKKGTAGGKGGKKGKKLGGGNQ